MLKKNFKAAALRIFIKENKLSPSLIGSILLVLPPTRLTRLEKKIDPPY